MSLAAAYADEYKAVRGVVDGRVKNGAQTVAVKVFCAIPSTADLAFLSSVGVLNVTERLSVWKYPGVLPSDATLFVGDDKYAIQNVQPSKIDGVVVKNVCFARKV